MFDRTTQKLASFAADASGAAIGEGCVSAAVRHHIDAIGCALGGLHSLPTRIARAVARTSPTPSGCSAIAVGERVVPEQAVFANACAVRQLDFNDGYQSPARSHPSDMLPAVIAAAELVGASGAQCIRGAYVSYEVTGALANIYPIRDAGWDHGVFQAAGAALGAGVVLGLNEEQLANALVLAVTPTMALRSTRGGELSHWKGCATAHCSMAGLFAARLAQRGLTGPSATFEGPSGLDEKVAPLRELTIGVLDDGVSVLERATFKRYPAEGASQGLIAALIEVRAQFEVDEIELITIDTWWGAWHEIGGGQGPEDHAAKWEPRTRETADHSLPYIAAVTLIDGSVTAKSFEPERFLDPALRRLLAKIVVRPRDAGDEDGHIHTFHDIRIDLRGGRSVILRSTAPIGSHERPMTDEDVNRKFSEQASTVLPDDDILRLGELLWSLPKLKDLDEITDIYRRIEVDDLTGGEPPSSLPTSSAPG